MKWPGGRERAALSGWAIVFFLALVVPQVRAASVYGDVEFAEGAAEIVGADGKSRASRAGVRIFEGETMRTGKDGEMHVKTSDHGLVALRSNSRVKVEIYRADGDAGDTNVLLLVAGTLRAVTGWIGRFQPGRYAVKTTVATIGIRGTDHEPLYVAPGEKSTAAPGTYDKVNAGSTYIETAAGRIVVEKGRAGFAPHDAKAAPMLLDKVPEVYRPSRNEERIGKRKAELEREMEKARLERQKAKASEKAEAIEKAGVAAAGKAEAAGNAGNAGKAENAGKADPSATEAPKAEAAKEEAHKKASERKRHRPESK